MRQLGRLDQGLSKYGSVRPACLLQFTTIPLIAIDEYNHSLSPPFISEPSALLNNLLITLTLPSLDSLPLDSLLVDDAPRPKGKNPGRGRGKASLALERGRGRGGPGGGMRGGRGRGRGF